MKALAVSLVLVASAALAQAPQFTIGPTVPLVAVSPGDAHPVSLAPGTGVSVGMDLLPGKLLSRDIHFISLGGDAFGSLLPNAGFLAVGIHAVVAELFSFGFGVKLSDTAKTGMFDGPLSSKCMMFYFGVDYGLLDLLTQGHQAAVPAVVQ